MRLAPLAEWYIYILEGREGMTDAITKQILVNMVVNLNRKARTTEANAYVLEGSFGKQQLYQCAPDSSGGFTARTRISPLLSKRELYMWLWAFMDGMDAGYERGYSCGVSSVEPCICQEA